MAKPISVEEADKLLRDHVRISPAIKCPLNKAECRVLREPLVADRDLPPFDRVMMDGYAIRSADLKCVRFKVAGKAPAGMPQQVLPDGDSLALEVMTGAPLPENTDTIIPVEWTDGNGDSFQINDQAEPKPGTFIHRKGSDFQAGDELVPAGQVFGPVEAGIAASCGYSEVTVSQRPRIAVFSTGDELVPVSEKPEPHQIRRSNSHAAENALAHADYAVHQLGHLTDDEESQADLLAKTISESEVVVISGAVSRGSRDWIPAALDSIGNRIFHGVAQRPGKPMGFWIAKSGCAVFALPGNPVSTLIAVHRYVIPYLDRMQMMPEAPPFLLKLSEEYSYDLPLTCFLPVKRSGFDGAMPVPVNNSGNFARLAESDGFLQLPAHENCWSAGLSFLYFPWKK